MRHSTRGIACAVVALAAGVAGQDALSAQIRGNVHPTKAVFADAESWPAIGPGDAALENFHPFRAVYERVYLGARPFRVVGREAVERRPGRATRPGSSSIR